MSCLYKYDRKHLANPELPNLKTVEYLDFVNRKGEVIYERLGNRIIFSATRGAREATSTVNAAEAVVVAICKQEDIDFTEPEFSVKFEFYDFSTPIGYPSREEASQKNFRLSVGVGDVEIDKLIIEPSDDYIHVRSWTPIRDFDFKNGWPVLPSEIQEEQLLISG